MKGIQLVDDDGGMKTAVVIDLKKHRRIWDNVYDALTAAKRKEEPRESLAQVKRRLRRAGKLKRNV
jgi:hypothetical protein